MAEKGWSNKGNGELLDLAAEREAYEVFVTTDQSLRFQQNLADRRVGLVLLSTDWREVRRRTSEINEAIAAVRPVRSLKCPFG